MVLPCVPATARHRRVAQMAASISERGTTRMPRACASASSGFSGGTAGENVTASAPATFSASMPHRHGDAVGAQALRHRRVLQVRARDRVTHRPEHQGDGAHAGAADAHDVDAPGRPRSRAASPSGPPHPRGRSCQRAWASTSSATRRRRVGVRVPRARPRAWRAGGRGRTGVHRAPRPAAAPSHSGSGTWTAAPMPTSASALRGLVVARGAGQRHQDGGDPGHEQLGHRHGTGPRHAHVGRAVEQRACGPRRAPRGGTSRHARRPPSRSAASWGAAGANAS